MDTKQQPTPSSETSCGDKRRGCGVRRCRGGAMFVLVAALLAGAAGGYVSKSFAHGPFGGPMGGHFASGAALDPGCDACAGAVCSQDSFCCSSSWDSLCVTEVDLACGQACP